MKNIVFLFLLLPTFALAQKTTILKGVIKDSQNKPIEGVSVKYNTTGTETDKNGKYQLRVPFKKEITIVFRHISYKAFTKKITAKNRNGVRFSATLVSKTEELAEVIVKDNTRNAQGITKIDPVKATTILGANEGVENILMTLPGVNNNNELSTQYNVRGGNFDENLVYVNGIEVYRPFLIRSGQQEGLSFINSNMVQNINFSAGGFQARYGDKLSSVLDITYRKAKEFATTIDASLLGASATIEGQLLNKKLSVITGI
ncbi:MAG: carboxypeptidase-like regulatory domain-containing protein, partial [Polaribacter sp.]